MAFVRDTNIVEICPLESPITTVDFLRYFYYSGVVYMTLRKYPDALECFDQVLSTPAHAISAVAVEAYRKATLVSLIERGKPYTLPRSASAIMSRVDSQAGSYECKTYKAISRAFCEGISLGDLSKEVESGKEDLEKHFNFGLAQLVLDAYPIRRLLQ
ncbi:csn3, partial [Symbiodinium microadriaticum]